MNLFCLGCHTIPCVSVDEFTIRADLDAVFEPYDRPRQRRDVANHRRRRSDRLSHVRRRNKDALDFARVADGQLRVAWLNRVAVAGGWNPTLVGPRIVHLHVDDLEIEFAGRGAGDRVPRQRRVGYLTVVADDDAVLEPLEVPFFVFDHAR